jgi:hypothetical protein
MNVQIEENLFLESDERNFVIREYTGKQDKKGNDLFKTHGFYSTVQQALNGLVQMKVKQSTAVTLSELVLDIESIKEYINSKVTV